MKLVFASNNQHKLLELRRIAGEGFEVLSLDDIGCYDDIPETSPTLEGNALQKARYIYEKYGLDCLADDTGLEVDVLGGAPGVHSARYATDGHDAAANMALLLANMVGKKERTARFRTVMALILGGKEYTFEGKVEGEILSEPHGTEGFGYDPVFRPLGFDTTFAQMSLADKNAISHRGAATRALVDFLKSQNLK